MKLFYKLIVTFIIFSVTLKLIDCANDDEYVEKWIKILDNIDLFVNKNTKQISDKLKSANVRSDVSVNCMKTIENLLLRSTKDEWALKMWDSAGHFPSGFLSGSFTSFGDYDQCLSIKGNVTTIEFNGKYCILELRPPQPANKINFNETKYKNHYYESVINHWVKLDGFAPLANGICIPSVCSQKEIEHILGQVFNLLSLFNLRVKYCTTQQEIDDKPLRFGQKIALTIVLLNVFLIIVGTLLRIFNANANSFIIKLLECFSLIRNNEILFKINTKTSKDEHFKYIHGLRVVSIFWVLISHIYLFHPFLELPERVSPIYRFNDITQMVQYLSTHLIINAGLAVGTFYIISGSLTIYSIIPVFKNNPINLFNYILLRWFRFTPPTIGMICFIVIWPLFGSGPIFHSEFIDKVTEPCYDSWWTNLLFINNWMHPSDMCNNITWYLSCDVQLHVLLYFVIYFYYRKQLISRIYIGIMIFLGFIIPVILVITDFEDAPNPSIFLHPEIRFPIKKVGIFIFATYNQLIPYFFGVILGLILVRKKKLVIKNSISWVIWIVLLPLTIFIPFSSHGFATSETVVDEPLESAIVFGIIRLLWSAGVTWICYECASGRAGLINKILSSNFLQPLSRLTFCIYLIHIVPVWHNFFIIRSPITISHASLEFIACANAVEAILLAYILYCIFEAPYVNVCKLLFMPSINAYSNNGKSNKNDNTIELNKNIA